MRRLLLWLLVVVSLVVAGSLAARWYPSRSPHHIVLPPPVLSIDPGALNFGEVWATERVEWSLPIVNRSDTEATLVSLMGDCSCVAMSPLPLRIEPGATANLALTLDLTSFCAASADDSRPYQIRLSGVVQTAGGEQPVEWILEGRARYSVRPTLRSVDFGRRWSPSLPLERTIDLRPSPHVGVIRAEVLGDPTGGVSAEVRAGAEGAGLLVRLNRVPPPGRYRCVVRLSPVGRGGEPLAEVRIPVEWEMLDEIQPDAPVVEFGPQPTGTVAEQVVTLSSLAGRPFRITSLDGGRTARLEPSSTGPDSVVRVRVVQRIE